MEIKLYRSERGTSHVEKYINKLKGDAVKRIYTAIEELSRMGYTQSLKSGKLKKLKGYELYEIIIKWNNVGYRIFCVIRYPACWLLHIFQKKSNSTPKFEIETALNRSKELDTRLRKKLN